MLWESLQLTTRDERFLLKIASHGAEIGKETVAVIIQGGFFLTVPPNFQYQNEKRWAANQRFWNWGGTDKKNTLYKKVSANLM